MYPQKIAIADADGRLRPFAEILTHGNDGLDALDRWFIENGSDREKKSLGGLARFLADRYDGRKNYAEARAKMFDNRLSQYRDTKFPL